MKKRIGIVLAAGQGKRMKSKLYKVLHPVCGTPMVGHVVSLLENTKMDEKIVVVGHGAEAVKEYLGERAQFVLQEEQLGTGHAVMQAAPLLQNVEGTTLVICGDTPLIRPKSVEEMIELHEQTGAAATIMTAELDHPHGYGRIVRSPSGSIMKIVEQKDCSEQEDQLKEINTATYCFDNQKLFQALQQVTNDNAQQEYYLTDVIGILKEQGHTIQGYVLEDVSEAVGINDRIALAEAEKIMREKICKQHMKNGVTIMDPNSTYIEDHVTIGMDTIIYPNTWIKAGCRIGENCSIGPNTELDRATIGSECVVKQAVVIDSEIGNRAQIGPFAYIRPGSRIGDDVKVGDFVEIKNASIDEGSKVPHLSYIGDAEIGKNVNVGCGSITANYDGFKKHLTRIEDGAFIGSNSNLIAPVTIGKNAFVVAGSTVTQDVEEDALAVARARQTTKAGYAEKLRKRIKQQKK